MWPFQDADKSMWCCQPSKSPPSPCISIISPCQDTLPPPPSSKPKTFGSPILPNKNVHIALPVKPHPTPDITKHVFYYTHWTKHVPLSSNQWSKHKHHLHFGLACMVTTTHNVPVRTATYKYHCPAPLKRIRSLRQPWPWSPSSLMCDFSLSCLISLDTVSLAVDCWSHHNSVYFLSSLTSDPFQDQFRNHAYLTSGCMTNNCLSATLVLALLCAPFWISCWFYSSSLLNQTHG